MIVHREKIRDGEGRDRPPPLPQPTHTRGIDDVGQSGGGEAARQPRRHGVELGLLQQWEDGGLDGRHERRELEHRPRLLALALDRQADRQADVPERQGGQIREERPFRPEETIEQIRGSPALG